MDSPDLKTPDFYINRELSLLEFNQRVLAQALDEASILPFQPGRWSTSRGGKGV